MDGILKDLLRGACFQEVAQVQDADAVGDVFHHGKIMGDEQIGGSRFLLDIFHQVYHLSLYGHIQGGDAFIGDDQFGIHDQGPGDAHSLALSAGELVGIAGGVLRGQAHLGQDGVDLLFALCSAGAGMVDVQTFSDDVLHFLSGI